uniref:Uncharacterized protein n=1 Tax=Anguilla anguilla TaxID=7936 RepID=A0A0E9WF21_ANGAN
MYEGDSLTKRASQASIKKTGKKIGRWLLASVCFKTQFYLLTNTIACDWSWDPKCENASHGQYS